MAASDAIQYQADALTKLIANVRPDQMSNSTPCSEWDVRGLLNHFVGGATMFAAMFNGEEITMDGEPPDLVGDDPLGAWTAAVASFNRAVDQPGAMERIVKAPFGEMPGQVLMQILVADLTIHCWDLAQATGQAYDPPADVVAAADAIAHQVITPAARGGGAFGPEVTPPAGATPIEQLVAFSGRSV